MTSKIMAVILTLVFSVNAMATSLPWVVSEPTNCNVPTRIEKGTPAPCTGYIMSPETEESLRINISYKDSLIKNLTQANTLQDDLIKIQSEQVKELSKVKDRSAWEKAFYFGLGAILTGAVAYGTVQALR